MLDQFSSVPDCPSRVRTDISQAEIQQAILTACEGSKKLFDNLPTNIQTQITENE